MELEKEFRGKDGFDFLRKFAKTHKDFKVKEELSELKITSNDSNFSILKSDYNNRLYLKFDNLYAIFDEIKYYKDDKNSESIWLYQDISFGDLDFDKMLKVNWGDIPTICGSKTLVNIYKKIFY